MSRARIESLDHEGRGVTHVDGKTIFVEGALPGETVEFSSYRRKSSYEMAQTTAIVKASSARQRPACSYFGICGGCSMQHLESGAQAAVKQRVLEDALWHLARLRPEVIYPAILGPAWGYRSRARLSARLVPKKGGMLVGFHEKRSSFIADMQSCEVLPPQVSRLLPKLRALIASLSIPDRIPQIEVAVADDVTALVIRTLEPLTAQDEAKLREFEQHSKVQLFLQPGGPQTARRFSPQEAPRLAYSLPEFGVRLEFEPTDFTQVNQGINRILVRGAMLLLAPAAGERIGDLFCGLGNFTLPIASLGARVVGVEGSAALVDRARRNAELNGLGGVCEYSVANLFDATPESFAALGPFDKLLIDPPREGAIAVVKALGADAPARIVYVSCNPATLARDAAVLVHEKGYRLKGAGIANMFPQTSHVESLALFERE